MVHKEGRKFLIVIFILLGITVYLFYSYIAIALAILIFSFFVSFFRKPKRSIKPNDSIVYAPADGKIVVIEETEENEYLNNKCIQVSIFMSVWNVHINWFPVNGIIKYFKHHQGKYLVARNPKSSTENERTTIAISTKTNMEIVLRQIAGIVARRIKSYVPVNKEAIQGDEMGFIKFGSRVDIFLPLSSKINVKLNQKVKGNKTVIAEL